MNISVGQELKDTNPWLRVEEIFTCQDEKVILRVKPFYPGKEALNRMAKSRLFFIEEIKEQGYLKDA